MVSPFTIEDLARHLDDEGLRYTRHQGQPVLSAYWGCERVPHTLRFVVDSERGYCSVYQHNLVAMSPGLVSPERLGEASRFALMVNGAVLFGGFMLYGSNATDLSFGAAVPTADTMLGREQVRDVISNVCFEIDAVYPWLQQVLWGGMSAEEAYAGYRGQWGDGGQAVDDDGPDGGPTDTSGEGAPDGGPWSVPDIDEIDDAFLASHDPADPFSAAAAEAILRYRKRDAQAGEPDRTQS